MYTFLLVDDSRFLRRGMKNAIKEAGFSDCRIIEAGDGEEALAELEKINYQVDAILSDMVMPKMGGLEFLQALAERNQLEACPVIIVTGIVSDKKSQTALENGARNLLTKPFTAESIGTALREILSA